MIELKVPQVGESITEVLVGEWLKAVGDVVAPEETLVMIETDKVTVELPAPSAGTVREIRKKQGESAQVGEVIGLLQEGEGAARGAPAPQAKPAAPPAAAKPAPEAARPAPAGEPRVMPAARRVMAENQVDASQVQATGPGGRVLKEDVLRQVSQSRSGPTAMVAAAAAPAAAPAPAVASSRPRENVKMTPLRRRVAERLVAAQHTAALLTTFNEVDMTAVKELRARNQEAFVAAHGIKLGFMSFFVKAAVEALKAVPVVNAQIHGDDIVYHGYYDIGVAVGSGRGLVVPVLRNAEHLSFGDIERGIADFANRAKDGKLTLDELQGGTFTISNGGIYGSMMSTPIINPPQSGILGMHAILDRPIAVGGQVVIRPMMYVALSYDHRLIDGREAVTFLKRIKECIEEPSRILLEL